MHVLLVGESWITYTYHIKGVDSFMQAGYGEGTKWLRQALESTGHTFSHLPSHKAIQEFPDARGLAGYDVVILSDIGSNTLLLPPETVVHSKATPNRLKAIQEFVAVGGGLVMVGGYMSFQGIEGKARFRGTAVEEVLPVTMEMVDDRIEVPEGLQSLVEVGSHPVVTGLPREWGMVLGYNKVTPKKDAVVLATCGADPLVVVGQYRKGRSMAFTTDCAPHWATPAFLEAPAYTQFWDQAVRWLGGGRS